jgi:hypothetical protein
MRNQLRCSWCEKAIEGDAKIERNVALHPACVTAAYEHSQTGVTTSHERSLHYVFVSAAVGLNDEPSPTPRLTTWRGFLARFQRRRGAPTDRMAEMLREAYIAGAIDGASAALLLGKK